MEKENCLIYFLFIANRFCSVFKDLASLTTKELMDVVK